MGSVLSRSNEHIQFIEIRRDQRKMSDSMVFRFVQGRGPPWTVLPVYKHIGTYTTYYGTTRFVRDIIRRKTIIPIRTGL